MVRFGVVTIVCAVLCGFSTAYAAPGDAEAGRVKAKKCERCHGEGGISDDPEIPHLANQFADYFVKQMIDFQMQNRVDELMTKPVRLLTTLQDLNDVAAYYAAQPLPRVQTDKKSDHDLGKTIYMIGVPARGIEACVGCHGVYGRGNAANNTLFPKIAGLQKKYVIKQFKDFGSAKRNTDPSGIMANIGTLLSSDELNAVADYTAGL